MFCKYLGKKKESFPEWQMSAAVHSVISCVAIEIFRCTFWRIAQKKRLMETLSFDSTCKIVVHDLERTSSFFKKVLNLFETRMQTLKSHDSWSAVSVWEQKKKKKKIGLLSVTSFWHLTQSQAHKFGRTEMVRLSCNTPSFDVCRCLFGSLVGL